METLAPYFSRKILGTYSQGSINHFLLQMNVGMGGPFKWRKYLDLKVPSQTVQKAVKTKLSNS